ncbi:hypothetical protein FVE85_0305 [Porphyridium purpureum]|uniref:Uncharacterized protein n=1 Tax=Porphyridium purpureum TaxID=35688 RepID=A0A5J4YZ33_PORPP|nr:hypothetical protein FVE85_0305 [Porphyridium purpureum]|eukprot:POR1282..scf208_2
MGQFQQGFIGRGSVLMAGSRRYTPPSLRCQDVSTVGDSMGYALSDVDADWGESRSQQWREDSRAAQDLAGLAVKLSELTVTNKAEWKAWLDTLNTATTYPDFDGIACAKALYLLVEFREQSEQHKSVVRLFLTKSNFLARWCARFQNEVSSTSQQNLVTALFHLAVLSEGRIQRELVRTQLHSMIRALSDVEVLNAAEFSGVLWAIGLVRVGLEPHLVIMLLNSCSTRLPNFTASQLLDILWALARRPGQWMVNEVPDEFANFSIFLDQWTSCYSGLYEDEGAQMRTPSYDDLGVIIWSLSAFCDHSERQTFWDDGRASLRRAFQSWDRWYSSTVRMRKRAGTVPEDDLQQHMELGRIFRKSDAHSPLPLTLRSTLQDMLDRNDWTSLVPTECYVDLLRMMWVGLDIEIFQESGHVSSLRSRAYELADSLSFQELIILFSLDPLEERVWNLICERLPQLASLSIAELVTFLTALQERENQIPEEAQSILLRTVTSGFPGASLSDMTQVILSVSSMTVMPEKEWFVEWVRALREFRDLIRSADALLMIRGFQNFKRPVRVPLALVVIWMEAFCADGLYLSAQDFVEFLDFLYDWKQEVVENRASGPHSAFQDLWPFVLDMARQRGRILPVVWRERIIAEDKRGAPAEEEP